MKGFLVKNSFIKIEEFDFLENEENINYDELEEENMWNDDVDLLNIGINETNRIMTKKQYIKREEEILLIRKIKNNGAEKDLALEKLIQSHIGFINSIIFGVVGRSFQNDIESLQQEGIIGLIMAIDKFDEKFGCRLLTFARESIRSEIVKYIQANRQIRFPQYISERVKKINDFKNSFFSDFLRMPTNKEISDKLKISEKAIDELWSLTQRVHSIDPSGWTYGSKINKHINIKTDNLNSWLEESAIIKEKKDVIMEIISSLPDEDQDVIKSRYGFSETGKKTLESIGLRRGISKQWVVQIERRALKKLKSKRFREKLEVYRDQ